MRIEGRGVGKHFGPVAALQGLDFEVASGSRLALVGPNGSGKSTLNRVLLGLVACQGSVRLDGRCPFRERVSVAHELAYVPQIAPQLAAPVGEVVRAIARVRGLAEAPLTRAARAFDLDLRALGPRPFRSLSGGTKQKLLLTLAFASRSSLMILDEPTGSLDPRTRESFFELFEALAASATLVLCSHRLDEVRPLVDRVLLLDDGRLAYDGPASTFLARAARATIEAWVDGDAAATWLAARGFRRSPAGMWFRTLDCAGKTKLLFDLIGELGPALRNVSARDHEGLALVPGAADG